MLFNGLFLRVFLLASSADRFSMERRSFGGSICEFPTVLWTVSKSINLDDIQL